jgi:hypothetical protein
VPDSKLQKAQQAFAEVTKVFRTPRCINCHGAVNPFGMGRVYHVGGQLEKSHDGDSFAQCQQCHGAFPDWEIPNASLFFTDKTDAQLCRQVKQGVGGDFIGHVENDHGGTQFIAVAFAGTRGLNEYGWNMAQKYPDPPPPDITRAGLISSARRWVEILRPYHAAAGHDDCGCVPQRYVLRIELQGTQAISMAGQSQINYEWKGQQTDFPLELSEDGTISSSGTMVLGAHEVVSLHAQNETCTAQGTMDGGKFSGQLKEEQVRVPPDETGLGAEVENHLQLIGKVTWLHWMVNGASTCTSKSGHTTSSTARNAPEVAGQQFEIPFKLPAQVSDAQKINLARPGGQRLVLCRRPVYSI